tara:strand:+ start:232 stop:564 length:333 start_codon:yes stop_codon:yes gene_type:complete
MKNSVLKIQREEILDVLFSGELGDENPFDLAQELYEIGQQMAYNNTRASLIAELERVNTSRLAEQAHLIEGDSVASESDLEKYQMQVHGITLALKQLDDIEGRRAKVKLV